jgi:hypothetical protein
MRAAPVEPSNDCDSAPIGTGEGYLFGELATRNFSVRVVALP